MFSMAHWVFFFLTGSYRTFLYREKILLCAIKAHKAAAYPPVSVVLSGWESLTPCGWDTSPSQVNPQHKPVPNFSLVVWDNLDKVPSLSAQHIQVTTTGLKQWPFGYWPNAHDHWAICASLTGKKAFDKIV